MSSYFVVCIGRSGSTWLASALGAAHEEADPRSKTAPHAFSPFPVERFWAGGPGYGECHGMLRYHLSGAAPGKERLIPRRAWLRRDPSRVIASWMNGTARKRDELASVCWEVLWHYANLRAWQRADGGARAVDLETLSENLEALREFAGWLGASRTPGPEDLRPVNEMPPALRRFAWGPEERDVLLRVGRHLAFEGIEKLVDRTA